MRKPFNAAAVAHLFAPQSPTKRVLSGQERKHGNHICYDLEGNKYHSKAERAILLEFKAHWQQGHITEPVRKRWKFEHNSVLIGTYTSDAEFSCLQAFSITTRAGTYSFEEGRDYTVDVKSPGTLTKDYKRTKKLMQAFHNVVITEVLTRPLPAAKSKRKSTRNGKKER